jgi:dipeptidyl aminopeptidase/acylaminoacyl peptidase
VDRLLFCGVDAELMTISGGGHGFSGTDAQKADEAMFAFFDRYLKK